MVSGKAEQCDSTGRGVMRRTLPVKRQIAVACPDLSGNELQYVTDCLRSGWISSLGSFIEKFESSFSVFCGTRHAVACNNGTSALHLALSALGLTHGDEVIVPALTFIATANAVRYCGATPVFADSEFSSMTMDPEQIEKHVNRNTRGIIVVHLFGRPANMDPILNIARRRGLWLVEDAAQAHGATYHGRRVGNIGDAATFSFFGNKIVTTGEGGMVTTNDSELAARMRILRAHGMSPERKYWFPVMGFNFRMTNIQAAIGLAQMERVEEMLQRRRTVAGWYNDRLMNVDGVNAIPRDGLASSHAYWAYVILLASQAERDRLIRALAEDGIETRPSYYPIHRMPPYLNPDSKLPNAEFLGPAGMMLPMHSLLTEDEVDFVVLRLKHHLMSQKTKNSECRTDVAHAQTT